MKKIILSLAALAALSTAALAEPNRFDVTNGQSLAQQNDGFVPVGAVASKVMLKKIVTPSNIWLNDDETRRLDEKNGSHG